MSSGGGGGESTSEMHAVPEEIMPQFIGMSQRAWDASNQGYIPYEGRRTAGPTELTQQAQTAAGSMQLPGQYGVGSDIALGMGQQAQQMGQALMPTGAGSWIDQGTSSAYMSPYMSGVIDVQTRQIDEDLARQTNQLEDQAAAAGGLGGYRNQLMASEASRAAGQRKDDVRAQGLQQAYETGMQAFNTDQARQLQQQQQQLQTAQYMTDTGLNAATTLGKMGEAELAGQQDIIGLQNQLGEQQRALEQTDLDTKYNDFLTQANWDRSQLEWLASMLTPSKGIVQNTTAYGARPSGAGQALGAGLSAYSLLGGGK